MLMSYISLAPSSPVARPSIGPHQPSPRSWPAYQQAEFGSHTRLGNMMLPIVFLNARCLLGLSLQDRFVGRDSRAHQLLLVFERWWRHLVPAAMLVVVARGCLGDGPDERPGVSGNAFELVYW